MTSPQLSIWKHGAMKEKKKKPWSVKLHLTSEDDIRETNRFMSERKHQKYAETSFHRAQAQIPGMPK